MEGCVDLGDLLHTEMVYLPIDDHQGGHSPGEPGRHGKVRESVLAYGQLPLVLILT